MKLQIIFPAQEVEVGVTVIPLMPMAPPLLAALTPGDVEVEIIDRMYGDKINLDIEADLVAISLRTPVATVGYKIADEFRKRGKMVCLGGPHATIFPLEAIKHADVVVIGEAEEIWPVVIEDFQKKRLKKFYVAGPFDTASLSGNFYHIKNRPTLKGLPIPKRDLLPRKRYLFDSIFTTRGCPNHCKFCPVTPLFGSTIRHRPIEEVIVDVETLRSSYFNVDDSIFGHPQLADRPEENKYYLDLYTELAKVRPKRQWGGAGGLSAVNYKDGRQILQKAAESGLVSIAAGIECITLSGQRQSEAWRKLHATNVNSFNLNNIKENIKIIQDYGIEIMGFFILGWDEDTIETYFRTLEFCLETNIIPVIFTLVPMPGSRIYEEFRETGRILEGLEWEDYGGRRAIFNHPRMTPEEMGKAELEVVKKGYALRYILRRSIHTFFHRPSINIFFASFFTQLNMKKAFTDRLKNLRNERKGQYDKN